MSLESDFNPPEKLIWTKVLVDDIEITAPHDPTKSVSELTLSYFLQPGGSKGVFIQHLQSSIISEDDAPNLNMVYISNEPVPVQHQIDVCWNCCYGADGDSSVNSQKFGTEKPPSYSPQRTPPC